MLPNQIDRYQIIEECGRGGMAIVYRAYDTHNQFEVALKVLPKEYLHDQQFRARFKREIDINSAFRHEGVVPVYGYGQVQGQLYLVMRYLPGGSLEDQIKIRKTIPLDEMTGVVSRVADVLDAAHQQGIVHRDMKPSNILFDEQGLAYVVDFGIARLAEAASFTMVNAIVGSPAYMSPEQAKSGKVVDGRCDLYSLGVMIFEALSGSLPFYDPQPMQLAMMHISDPIPDIRALNSRLPVSCQSFILTALAKEPDERFQTAGELARAFNDVLRGGARHPVSPFPAHSPAPPPSRAPSSPAPSFAPQSARSAPSASPAPRPIQSPPPTPSSPSPSPASATPKGPRALPNMLKPLSQRLMAPALLRAPTVPHFTLPAPIRRYAGLIGLPTTIHLPRSNRGWLTTTGVIVVILLAMCGACAGLVYLLFRYILIPRQIIPWPLV